MVLPIYSGTKMIQIDLVLGGIPRLSLIQHSLYVGVIEKILTQPSQGSSMERWSRNTMRLVTARVFFGFNFLWENSNSKFLNSNSFFLNNQLQNWPSIPKLNWLHVWYLDTGYTEYRGIARLFIPVLTGTYTVYLQCLHSAHGKLYCSGRQNLSNLDLKLFIDWLSIIQLGASSNRSQLSGWKMTADFPIWRVFSQSSGCDHEWLMQHLVRRI